MSELRSDVLTGDTVIVAPARRSRPQSDGGAEPACPFCPGHEDETPAAVMKLPPPRSRAGRSSQWFVRVFPNLYPIVSTPLQVNGRNGDEAVRLARGVHEVIVETPDHDQPMVLRTPAEIRPTLVAYRTRLASLLETRGIRYVTVFQNQGDEAGASLGHPHSQVVALRYVPRAVSRTVQRWRRFLDSEGKCLLCTELDHELGLRDRVVFNREGFVLFVPHAVGMSGELILAPVQHQPSFTSATDETLSRMSRQLLAALQCLHSAFDSVAYNLVLQTWPRSREQDDALHWYLRVIPRLSYLGGFELATGDHVSTLTPEDAAALYRGETFPE